MKKQKTKEKQSVHTREKEILKAIEEAAYYKWLDRGRIHGLDEDDWLEAEEERRNMIDIDPEI